MDADELYARAIEPHLGDPGVVEGMLFGSEAVKDGGKVFAALRRDHLLVKLPAERVVELAAAGGAEAFDPGMGRTMREWALVAPGRGAEWPGLVSEARAYVAALRG